MTTTETPEVTFTTIDATQFVLGPADQVVVGAKFTIGTNTVEITKLVRKGVIKGREVVAARYNPISHNGPKSSATWGDDPQGNELYWMGR